MSHIRDIASLIHMYVYRVFVLKRVHKCYGIVRYPINNRFNRVICNGILFVPLFGISPTAGIYFFRLKIHLYGHISIADTSIIRSPLHSNQFSPILISLVTCKLSFLEINCQYFRRD